MEAVLASATLVVVAQNFNPSIFSQLWLVKNGIVGEEDFLDGCVFLPVVSQIQSRDFTLVVLPEQLQFAPKFHGNEEEQTILQKAEKLMESLPHTPFTASGLNFVWHIVPADGKIGGLSHKLFFRNDIPLFSHFQTSDAQFGSYLSKNELGGRLKLDVKPVSVTEVLNPGVKTEKLQFAFNFHYDLVDDDKASELIGIIRKWREAKLLAWEILKDTIGMI